MLAIQSYPELPLKPNIRCHWLILLCLLSPINLLPVDIIPDYNRDGKITEADRGKVSSDNPYRFWVNDDDDWVGEDRKVKASDIPGSDDAASNGVIDGVRDLVDFFPLHLDLASVLGSLPRSDYKYLLKHSQGAVKFHEVPETKLEQGHDNDGPTAYLKDVVKARSLDGAAVQHANTAGTELSGEILDAFENGDGVLLCEIIKETEAPLILEIQKSDGSSVGEIEFPIKTSGVEDMYRHVNLRNAAGGSGGRGTENGVPPNYPDDLPGLESDKFFVLVHGYNVNGEQARGWHAEVFKRMWWSGSKAKYVGVSWHGDESQIGSLTPNYHANVVNAFQTSESLAAFLSGFALSGEISIAAHSLGNMVVSSSISDHAAPVQHYMMFDAAVAIESYDAVAQKKDSMLHPEWSLQQHGGPFPEKVWASEWYTLPWPQGDKRKELTWRGRLKNRRGATYYNFYSSGEEVLREHNDPTDTNLFSFIDEQLIDILNGGETETGLYSWVFQEKLKGRTLTGQVLGSRWGGWGFNIQRKPGPFLPWTPEHANTLTNQQLMENPYWRRGGEDLGVNEPHAGLFATGTAGSNYAANKRSELLAEGFPARTLPAGANPIGIFDFVGANYNMMNMKNQWHPGNPNWLHGDIKDVSYTFTWKVYEEFTNLGGLDD